MTQETERILIDKKCIAIVLKKDFSHDGLEFVTDQEMPFQLGIHQYKNKKETRIHGTSKIQLIKIKKISKYLSVQSGMITAEFYNKKNVLLRSCTLKRGESILIFDVIHKIIFGKNSKVVEVKQGPYQYD